MDVINLRPDLPADLQEIAEALIGDDRDLTDPSLDQRVRAYRRTVRQANHVARVEAVFLEHSRDPFDDGGVGAVGRRWKLMADLAILVGTADGQVGEGTADIDANVDLHTISHVDLLVT